MNTKTCTKCRVEKPCSAFTIRRDRPIGFQATCKACKCERQRAKDASDREAIKLRRSINKIANLEEHRAARRAYARLNPDKKRAGQLRYRYGISVEQYNEMFMAQNGACLICEITETRVDYRSGEPQFMPIDHDGETGAIRGLLCHKCNSAIGLLGHDPNLFEAAIAYLKRPPVYGRKKETIS